MEALRQLEAMNTPNVDRANNARRPDRKDSGEPLGTGLKARTRRTAEFVFYLSLIVLTAILCVIFWNLLNRF